MPPSKQAAAPDFAAVFTALKKILAAHAARTVIVHDTADHYCLNSTILHPKNKHPLCFGAVKIEKNYVSFHFMPVYGHPPLLAGLSPALKKRMQGKACFNFTTVDEPLFVELATLTHRGAAAFAKGGFL